MPRLFLALAGIAVIGVICIGIKDYLRQPKDATPSSSKHTQRLIHSSGVTDSRKVTPAKTGRVRLSASEADASPAQTAADDMQEPPTSEEFANAVAKATAAHDEVEAAKDRNNRGCYYPPPLPNSTKPADIDAVYYYNWAREYCEFVGVEMVGRR